MAKQVAAKKQKSIEESIWDSANKLRGPVESTESLDRRRIFEKYKIIGSM